MGGALGSSEHPQRLRQRCPQKGCGAPGIGASCNFWHNSVLPILTNAPLLPTPLPALLPSWVLLLGAAALWFSRSARLQQDGGLGDSSPPQIPSSSSSFAGDRSLFWGVGGAGLGVPLVGAGKAKPGVKQPHLTQGAVGHPPTHASRSPLPTLAPGGTSGAGWGSGPPNDTSWGTAGSQAMTRPH